MKADFQNFTDMINGGGRGGSGATFQGGGLLSQFGNNMRDEADYQRRWAEQQRAQGLQRMFGQMSGGQPWNPMRQPMYEPQRPRLGDFNSFGDMFDGGGAGQSGNTFQGGGLWSSILNLVGGKN